VNQRFAELATPEFFNKIGPLQPFAVFGNLLYRSPHGGVCMTGSDKTSSSKLVTLVGIATVVEAEVMMSMLRAYGI
jgi:hypothetical protein